MNNMSLSFTLCHPDLKLTYNSIECRQLVIQRLLEKCPIGNKKTALRSLHHTYCKMRFILSMVEKHLASRKSQLHREDGSLKMETQVLAIEQNDVQQLYSSIDKWGGLIGEAEHQTVYLKSQLSSNPASGLSDAQQAAVEQLLTIDFYLDSMRIWKTAGFPLQNRWHVTQI